MDELIAELRRALGDDAIVIGDEARARMTPGSLGTALLRPNDTAQVSLALALCHRAGQAVVPQGGLTGLVQGTFCAPGQLALSLDRLRCIEGVDPINRCMHVDAGVTLQRAQEAAEQADLMLAVDLGARGTATIGGAVSTNAGGTRVLRYGMMRDSVLGLEAVLADGTVVDTRRKIIKNNAGYDLRHLFIGSEGTLGVVTRVVLRLRPRPRSQQTALVALDGFEAVTRCLRLAEAHFGGALSSWEVMWPSFYDLVTTPPARGRALLERGHAYYVLIETLGSDPARDWDTLAALLDRAQTDGLVADAVLAGNAAERRALWAMREDVDQLARDGPYLAYDVSVPIDAMPAYVAAVQRQLSACFARQTCHVYGHIADGNLHLGIRVDEPHADDDVHEIVYGALPGSETSVSAEHGVGLLKKAHLSRSRSQPELALMRTLKQALDPRGILNPGKIFDLPSTPPR